MTFIRDKIFVIQVVIFSGVGAEWLGGGGSSGGQRTRPRSPRRLRPRRRCSTPTWRSGTRTTSARARPWWRWTTARAGSSTSRWLTLYYVIHCNSSYYYSRCPGRWNVRLRVSSLVTTPSPGAGTPGPGAGAGWATWSGRSWRANTSSTSSPTTRSSGRGSSLRRATSTSAKWRFPRGEYLM